ncbi:hypothetical protein ACLB1Q_14075 [Escherichia coli]
MKKGEKAIDVASVVRQKMPANVKDRDAWAKDLATTFESQGLAPTLKTSARCWRWRSRSQIIRQYLASGLKQNRLARDRPSC